MLLPVFGEGIRRPEIFAVPPLALGLTGGSGGPTPVLLTLIGAPAGYSLLEGAHKKKRYAV